MNLAVLEGSFSVCRLPGDAPVPTAVDGPFWSLVRTRDEVSVVCPVGSEPADARIEAPWKVFVVEGQLDFGLTGVLAALATPLAEANVSIFAISTYDTDYVLVHAAALERAVEALRAAGHTVHAG